MNERKRNRLTRNLAGDISRLAGRTEGACTQDDEKLGDIELKAEQIKQMFPKEEPKPEPEPGLIDYNADISIDFLKMGAVELTPRGPDYRPASHEIAAGFPWTTLGYLNKSKRERIAMIEMAQDRGYSGGFPVYIDSANDIGVGTFNFWREPNYVIDEFSRLLEADLPAIPFCADDEDNARLRNIDAILRDWNEAVPLWIHLCRIASPKLEGDEKIGFPALDRMGRELRKIVEAAGTGTPIGIHLRGDDYHSADWWDVCLWQTDTWNHKEVNGKKIKVAPRRQSGAMIGTDIRGGKDPDKKVVSRPFVSALRSAVSEGKQFAWAEHSQMFWDSEDWTRDAGEAIRQAMIQEFKKLGVTQPIMCLNGCRP